MFWLLFGTRAFAQATSGGAQPSGIEMFLPFIFIIGIFYFLIILPQSKKQKEHQKFVIELKRGDAVITTGGILGTIEGLNENFVTLEIADGVRIKILRSQILSSQAKATATEGKK
ncbi:MAG: preprotein translocase subunit YajC [Pseudobdellovibrionaceae bacterium]